MIAPSWTPADRAVAARVVRVRSAVPVDARRRQARDELVALSADHGGLPVRARLSGVVRDLSNRSRDGQRLTDGHHRRPSSLPRSSRARRSTPRGCCCRRACGCAVSERCCRCPTLACRCRPPCANACPGPRSHVSRALQRGAANARQARRAARGLRQTHDGVAYTEELADRLASLEGRGARPKHGDRYVMTLVTLIDAELAYGMEPLLDRAQPGGRVRERIGLIGRNGTGKSSLCA